MVTADLTLTGRLTTASNATFLGSTGDAAVVCKPIAGEKPLSDFPDGCVGFAICTPSGNVLREPTIGIRRPFKLDHGLTHAHSRCDPPLNTASRPCFPVETRS
ncbi:hypothetical protein ABIB35_001827 [Arthrobacter sp. UYP6]